MHVGERSIHTKRAKAKIICRMVPWVQSETYSKMRQMTNLAGYKINISIEIASLRVSAIIRKTHYITFKIATKNCLSTREYSREQRLRSQRAYNLVGRYRYWNKSSGGDEGYEAEQGQEVREIGRAPCQMRWSRKDYRSMCSKTWPKWKTGALKIFTGERVPRRKEKTTREEYPPIHMGNREVSAVAGAGQTRLRVTWGQFRKTAEGQITQSIVGPLWGVRDEAVSSDNAWKGQLATVLSTDYVVEQG